jgi:hypothetical protein
VEIFTGIGGSKAEEFSSGVKVGEVDPRTQGLQPAFKTFIVPKLDFMKITLSIKEAMFKHGLLKWIRD